MSQEEIASDGRFRLNNHQCKIWQDLKKPKLQATDRVLGAFKGQS